MVSIFFLSNYWKVDMHCFSTWMFFNHNLCFFKVLKNKIEVISIKIIFILINNKQVHTIPWVEPLILLMLDSSWWIQSWSVHADHISFVLDFQQIVLCFLTTVVGWAIPSLPSSASLFHIGFRLFWVERAWPLQYGRFLHFMLFVGHWCLLLSLFRHNEFFVCEPTSMLVVGVIRGFQDIGSDSIRLVFGFGSHECLHTTILL